MRAAHRTMGRNTFTDMMFIKKNSSYVRLNLFFVILHFSVTAAGIGFEIIRVALKNSQRFVVEYVVRLRCVEFEWISRIDFRNDHLPMTTTTTTMIFFHNNHRQRGFFFA